MCSEVTVKVWGIMTIARQGLQVKVTAQSYCKNACYRSIQRSAKTID